MQTGYEMFIETDVPENELIVSRTDLSGCISYANETFASISGYEVGELLGKPHNIVRHPDMPHSIFKQMWHSLKQGEIWKGYVKNLRKDGGYYWVYAEVSGVYKDGKLIEYKSMRSPVSSETKKKMQQAYDTLKAQEEGVSRVVLYLNPTLLEKVQKLAKEEKCSGDQIVNDLLNNSLF